LTKAELGGRLKPFNQLRRCDLESSAEFHSAADVKQVLVNPRAK
jgi:hypothetical protein